MMTVISGAVALIGAGLFIATIVEANVREGARRRAMTVEERREDDAEAAHWLMYW